MTEKTARAEDAAAPPEGTQPAGQRTAQAEADPVALAVELRDRLLRTLAEMENLRKRTEREVADSRLYGIASFARDMLGVADNMRRALDAISPETRQSAEPGVKALIDGVELTERELIKALEKNGVRQFSPRGEKFDPNVHQAMFEVPNPSDTGRQRRRGRAAGLHDRRARAASGAGWRVEGWTQIRAAAAAGQRQRGGTGFLKIFRASLPPIAAQTATSG